MSKITILEALRLSLNATKKYVDDNKVTDANEITIADTAGNFTTTNVEEALAELFQFVSNGKILIASAITDMGVTTSNTDSFEVMANKIKSITNKIACTGITLNQNTLNINKTQSISGFKTNSYVAKATPNKLDNDIYFGCFTEFYPVSTGDVVTLELNKSVENGLLVITTDTPSAAKGVEFTRGWNNTNATNTYTILEGQKYITFRMNPEWETYLVDIKINGASILNVSDSPSTTYTLTATVTPSNTTDEIIWSVSPEGVCSVENGVITPITTGTCTVTATCGTQSATCNVTVNSSSSGGSSKNILLPLIQWGRTSGITSVTANGDYSATISSSASGENLFLILFNVISAGDELELSCSDMSSNLKIEIVDSKNLTVKSMLSGGQTVSITADDALPYAIRIWVNSGTGGTISNISLINKSASSSGSGGSGGGSSSGGSSGDGPF